MTEPLHDLALDAIDPSPSNPRKHFNEQDLRELAADLLANGLISPITVRPRGDRFELVVGERRVRASRLAGLTTISARVRELTDRQVLEMQISENGQRLEVHPLEEADALLALHSEPHHVPVDEIAAHIGMRPAFVHARLALARMIPEARDAFAAGTLTTGIASLLARMGKADDQRTALTAFLAPTPYYNSAGWTVADAGRWIRDKFHLRLAKPPFDVTNVSLVPQAGACTTCPKNTATQIEMFAEVREAECTDRECFQLKSTRTWEAMTEEARTRGQTVLSIEESSKAVPYSAKSAQNGYALLDDKPYQFSEGRRTWAQLLKDHLPPVVIARGPGGELVEVIRPDDLKAAIKAAGLGKKKNDAKSSSKSSRENPPKGSGLSNGNSKAAREEADLRDEIYEKVRDAALAAMQARQVTDPNDRALWQWLTHCLVELCDPYTTDTIFARRTNMELSAFRAKYLKRRQDNYAEEIEVLSGSGCRVLITDLLLGTFHEMDIEASEKRTLAFLKIDRAKIVTKVRDEHARPEPPKPAAKPTASKPGAKKPAPRTLAGTKSTARALTKAAAKKPTAKPKGKGR